MLVLLLLQCEIKNILFFGENATYESTEGTQRRRRRSGRHRLCAHHLDVDDVVIVIETKLVDAARFLGAQSDTDCRCPGETLRQCRQKSESCTLVAK